jgi:hypothetical protein
LFSDAEDEGTRVHTVRLLQKKVIGKKQSGNKQQMKNTAKEYMPDRMSKTRTALFYVNHIRSAAKRFSIATE